MRDIFESFAKWFLGAASAGTVWVAEVVTLTDEVKLIAGMLGCVVSILFVISLCFDVRRKWRKRNE